MAFTLAAAPSSPATSGGFRVPTTGTAATPTIPTTIKTLPGGGAYNEGAPGQDINTGHTSYAGMPAKQGFQRNDIIPVSLGGSNQTSQNMEYEPEKEAAYRDNVEKYYANQVKSGAVPLNAARVAVLNWRQTDIPNQTAYEKQFGGNQDIISGTIKGLPEATSALAKSYLDGVKTVAQQSFQSETEGFDKISEGKTSVPENLAQIGAGAFGVIFSEFAPVMNVFNTAIQKAGDVLSNSPTLNQNDLANADPNTNPELRVLNALQNLGGIAMGILGLRTGEIRAQDIPPEAIAKVAKDPAVVDAAMKVVDAQKPVETAVTEQPSVAPETPAETPAVTPETPVAPVAEPKLGYTKTIEPKAPPTPDEQLPTIQMNKLIRSGGVQNLKPIKGTGELKTRGTFTTLEAAAIQKNLTEGFSGFPTFKGADFKAISEKVIKNIAKDPEGAMKIAMGEKGAPAGSIPEMYYNVLSKKAIAEGDVATIQKLATESKLSAGATTMGQRIAALGYQKEAFDPVAAIKEVQDARAAALAKKSTESVESVTKTITRTIRARNTKASWGDFVDSITC